MKKLFVFLVLINALYESVSAQHLSVSDIEALPGEKVSFTIFLDTDGGSYTGLEFDIQFPQNGFSTTGDVTTTADWDGAFTIGDVGGVGINNLARCGVLSYSNTAIPYDGLRKLGTVAFFVGSDVSFGNYTVTLTNIALVGDDRVALPEVTFTLSVLNATEIKSMGNSRHARRKKAFNLNGQRVSEPVKGLYIVNGKKVKQ